SLNAAIVFSGARPEAPRCAMTSGFRRSASARSELTVEVSVRVARFLFTEGSTTWMENARLSDGAPRPNCHALGFLTFGADSKNAVAVMKRFESVLLHDLVLQLLDLFIEELDQRAALCAYQVIVMAVLVVVFVQSAAVVKLELSRQPAIL